jgi:hypothetical protein
MHNFIVHATVITIVNYDHNKYIVQATGAVAKFKNDILFHTMMLMIVNDDNNMFIVEAGNTKGGGITVLLTSYLTGLESTVWLLTIFVFICKTG